MWVSTGLWPPRVLPSLALDSLLTCAQGSMDSPKQVTWTWHLGQITCSKNLETQPHLKWEARILQLLGHD